MCSPNAAASSYTSNWQPSAYQAPLQSSSSRDLPPVEAQNSPLPAVLGSEQAARLRSLLHSEGITGADGRLLERYRGLFVAPLTADAVQTLTYRQLYRPIHVLPRSEKLEAFHLTPLQWFSKIMARTTGTLANYWDTLLTGSAIPFTTDYQQQMLKQLAIKNAGLRRHLEEAAQWKPAWSNLDYLIRVKLSDPRNRDSFEAEVLAALGQLSGQELSASDVRSSCLLAHHRFGDSATVYTIGTPELSMDLVIWYEPDRLPELFQMNDLMVSVHDLLISTHPHTVSVYPKCVRSSVWDVLFDRWQKILRFHQPDDCAEHWNEGLIKKLVIYQCKGYSLVQKGIDKKCLDICLKGLKDPRELLPAVERYAKEHLPATAEARLAYTLQWMWTLESTWVEEHSDAKLQYWRELSYLLYGTIPSGPLGLIATFVKKHPQHTRELFTTLRFGAWLHCLSSTFCPKAKSELCFKCLLTTEAGQPAAFLRFAGALGIKLSLQPAELISDFLQVLRAVDPKLRQALLDILERNFPLKPVLARIDSEQMQGWQALGIKSAKLLKVLPQLITSQPPVLRQAALLLSRLTQAYEGIYGDIALQVIDEIPTALAEAPSRALRNSILDDAKTLICELSGEFYTNSRACVAVLEELKQAETKGDLAEWKMALLCLLWKQGRSHLRSKALSLYEELWSDKKLHPSTRVQIAELAKTLGIPLSSKRSELEQRLAKGQWEAAAGILHERSPCKVQQSGLTSWQVLEGWIGTWKQQVPAEGSLALACSLFIRDGKAMRAAMRSHSKKPLQTWQQIALSIMTQLLSVDAKGNCSPVRLTLALQLHAAFPKAMSKWERQLMRLQARAFPHVFVAAPELQPSVLDLMEVTEKFLQEKEMDRASSLAVRLSRMTPTSDSVRQQLLISHVQLFGHYLSKKDRSQVALHHRTWRQVSGKGHDKVICHAMKDGLFQLHIGARDLEEARALLGKMSFASSQHWIALLKLMLVKGESMEALDIIRSRNFESSADYKALIRQVRTQWLSGKSPFKQAGPELLSWLWGELSSGGQLKQVGIRSWEQMLVSLHEAGCLEELWQGLAECKHLGKIFQGRNEILWSMLGTLLNRSREKQAPESLKAARDTYLTEISGHKYSKLTRGRYSSDMEWAFIRNVCEIYKRTVDPSAKRNLLGQIVSIWRLLQRKIPEMREQERIDKLSRFILKEKLLALDTRSNELTLWEKTVLRLHRHYIKLLILVAISLMITIGIYSKADGADA